MTTQAKTILLNMRLAALIGCTGTATRAICTGPATGQHLPTLLQALVIAEQNAGHQLANGEPYDAQAPARASSDAPDQVKGQQLTRTEAEQMAIKNNPRVSVGRLLALAQHQVVRETRAAELPDGNRRA